jgi:hypothetical protein
MPSTPPLLQEATVESPKMVGRHGLEISIEAIFYNKRGKCEDTKMIERRRVINPTVQMASLPVPRDAQHLLGGEETLE